MRAACLLSLSAVLIAGVGCESTYNERYKFVPQPAEVAADPGDGDGRVLTLASIIGVRNPDEEAGLPLSVEARLAIQNEGDEAVRFNPDTLRLTSGDLRRFENPITQPPEPVTIGPGETQTVTAYFPFPPGADADGADLSGLNLQWAVGEGRQRVPQSVTFHRRTRDYDRDPYYGRRPGFGIGIGVGTVID